MAALRVVITIAAVTICPAAQAQNVAGWHDLIAEASVRFGMPEAWIERVMAMESGGRTRLAGRPIRSRKGAIGLMQLMPATWADMTAKLGLGADPDEPRANILAGSYYLRLMYDRFGYPGCFAAYNAGPARYAAYVAGRARLPAETIIYLARTAGTPMTTIVATDVTQSGSSIFFLRREPIEPSRERK